MIFERTFAYAGENLSEIWTGIAILPGWHSGHSDTPPRRRVVVLITTHMAEMCTEKRRDAPSCMQKNIYPLDKLSVCRYNEHVNYKILIRGASDV